MQWPHLLAINIGQGSLSLDDPDTTTLDQLPFQMDYRDNKKLVLRGAILGDNSHFTAIIRLQYCWMHYDGMYRHHDPNSIRFHTYRCNDPEECRKAMHNRAISVAFYEVLDGNSFTETNNPCFGDWNFDIETVLAHHGCKNSLDHEYLEERIKQLDKDEQAEEKTDEEEEEEAEEEEAEEEEEEEEEYKKETRINHDKQLKDLNKSIKEMKKDTPPTRKKARSPSSTSPHLRFPPGFSVNSNQRTGKQAICQGCKNAIDRNELRIRHNYTAPQHKYPTRNQYHCNAKCLMKMLASHLQEFLNDSTQGYPKVLKIKKEIETILKGAK